MNTKVQLGNIAVSPVNIEDRKNVDIRPGDTVRVLQKVEEAGKVRLQPFEGVVLARKHGAEPGATFTVRRVGDPYGTEKIFPLYSPMIDKIEILRRSKVRRSKLYHIRDKAAREIKRQMRNMRFVDIATESDTEAQARAQEEAERAQKEAEEKEKQTAEAQAENTEETTPDANNDTDNDSPETTESSGEEKKEEK